MTEVRYTEREENGKMLFRIYSCGHCGLIERGVDIGCRASSALISALITTVYEYDGDKLLRTGDGVAEIEIRVPVGDCQIDDIRGAFRVVRYGFEALEKMYPNNFCYEETVKTAREFQN